MIQSNQSSPSATMTPAPHPLDPLGAEEISAAVHILRGSTVFQALSTRVRLATIALHEPSKENVLSFRDGDAIDRAVFISVLDCASGMTFEAVVSITAGMVNSWCHIPGVQPAITVSEIQECVELVKADPSYQEALRIRSITNLDMVVVEPWSVGNFGREEEQRLRLSRVISFVRATPTDNPYARPIEGVVVLVDLNRMAVLAVEDYGIVSLPPTSGDYSGAAIGPLRTDLKPLEISQPDGPSFAIDGPLVRWQKWQLRIGFTAREGLVLHTIGYEDGGRVRSILYRASLSELVVPYGSPKPTHYFRNAFDAGEVGLGALANTLELGCDCLGEIRYFDAVVGNTEGEPVVLPNAICLHEEDYGLLWKHHDWRTGQTEVRRSRRLVVSMISTFDNYEYGFYWYFYQDGTIQYEVKLTGIVLAAAVSPGETLAYGVALAPELSGVVHQHFFNMRLDMDIDGSANTVYEVHTEAMASGPENPYGNAFACKKTVLATEQEAQQIIDPLVARCWEVANPTVRNSHGLPVAYRLMPGENVLPFAHAESSIIKRAAFITKHLWVTPYESTERYAAGDYPNQHPGGAGLPTWTQANRSIEDRDVVLWYTFGHHHVPRPEDWPVMPVGYIGFLLKPAGFFDRNPSLDVPPPLHHDILHK